LRLGGVMECAKIQIVYPASATCVSLTPTYRSAPPLPKSRMWIARPPAPQLGPASEAGRQARNRGVEMVEIGAQEALESFRTFVFLKQDGF
jgi:hypothetical protein